MDKETKNHRQKNNKKSIYRRQMSGTNLSLPGDLIKEIGFPSYTKTKTYWHIDNYYNQAVLTSEVSEEMLIEDISLGTISDVESNESDDQFSGGRIRIPEDMSKICFSRLENCDEVILIPVYQHKNQNLDNTLVYVCPAREFDELVSTIVSNRITHRGPNVLPENQTQIDLIPKFSPSRVDENKWSPSTDDDVDHQCPAQEFDEVVSTVVSNRITNRGSNVPLGYQTQIDLIPKFSPSRVDENKWSPSTDKDVDHQGSSES